MKILYNMLKSKFISLKSVALNTNWFEKNIEKDNKNDYLNNLKKEKIEIKLKIEKIQIIRKKLMKELYENEYKIYQKELSDKGLAIHKDRY